MRSIKNSLSALLRKTGLLYTADYLKFIFQHISNYSRNRQFKKQYPTFALPPDYHLYETFTLDYHEYKYQGELNAEELVELIGSVTDLSIPGKKILDWGCGPARVVRHLPGLLLNKHSVYATDYNKEYIKWCSSNLPGISFSSNELYPPLPFADDYFDIVFSISILTHLSEKNHYEWIGEMKRVLKPAGLLIITTQGNAYKEKMLAHELAEFEKGHIVIRDFLKEGHRIFSAFQPETFMRKLLKDFEIIDCQRGDDGTSIHGKQDTWIAKKK